jgi:hypothetical protein
MRNFGLINHARREYERTFVPPDIGSEAHGDFPHFTWAPLDDLDRDANHDFRFIVLVIIGMFVIASVLLAACSLALARDLDGRYANSPLHDWFEHLSSGRGPCCSFADGRSVADPDWGTAAVATADGNVMRYWVIVDGQKIIVPPEAVITEPNRDGRAIVWPYQDAAGTQIRCFMPGAGT